MSPDLSPLVWDAPRPEIPVLALTMLPFEGEHVVRLDARPLRLHRGARRRAEALLAVARAGGERAPVTSLAALDDAEAVALFTSRPDLFTANAEDGEVLERLTVRFGLDFVPGLASYALAHPRLAAPILGSVCSPRVAPAFALLLDHPDSRDSAEEWMLADASRAARGLWPFAVGTETTMRGPTARALRLLAWMGCAPAVREQASHYALDSVLDALLRDDRPPRPKARALDHRGLPIVRDRRGRIIEPSELELFAELLRASPLRPPWSALARARAALHAADVDALVLAWFDRFFATGERDEDRWMMHAPALAGGDLAVLGLVSRLPRLGAITPEHARVVLDSLAAIGNPLALLELESLVQRSGAVAWLDHARRSVADVRARRGHPRFGVGPEHVPDLFEGAREIELRVEGRDLRARVDERGNVVTVDDEGAVPWQSLADARPIEIEALERGAELVSSLLALRLERAMVGERALSPASFAWLARSCSLRPTASTIVFRLGQGGPLVRIVEDGTLVDLVDRVVPPVAEVFVAHPVSMRDDERAAWRAHLADHEIVQAFDQLDRAIAPGADWPAWQQASTPLEDVASFEDVGWRGIEPLRAGSQHARLTLAWSIPLAVSVQLHERVGRCWAYDLRAGNRPFDRGPAPLVARSELCRALSALGRVA